MSYRLRIRNPGSELVLSDEVRGLYCVGKAALYQGYIAQPTGSATGPSPGRSCGYSVYRFSYPNPVVFAIEAGDNRTFGFLSVTKLDATTWEIMAYCGANPDAYGFDTVQVQVNIWAYSYVNSLVQGGIGVIRNERSEIAYDFSHPNPLFPRMAGVIDFNAGSSFNVSGVARPVILGCPTAYMVTQDYVSPKHFANVKYVNMWTIHNGVLQERRATKQRWEYSAVEPLDLTGEYSSPTSFFVIEGTNLP